MAFVIVYITYGTEEDAHRISRMLVEERLVACANIHSIQSLYWWHDIVQTEDEWVGIVKTTRDKWEQLKQRVESLHPYDTPCIMKFDVEANEKYEAWIRDSVLNKAKKD
jgi:periplasmic divalent cation tolerance protein